VPDAAALAAAPPAARTWPPVAGPFCAAANEAPPISSALTIIKLFRVVIEASSAKTTHPGSFALSLAVSLELSRKRTSPVPKTDSCNAAKTCLFGRLVGVGSREAGSSRHSTILLMQRRLGDSIPPRASGSNGSTRVLFLYPRGGRRCRWRLTR